MSFYRLSIIGVCVCLAVFTSCKDNQSVPKTSSTKRSKDLIPDSIPVIETIKQRRERYEAAIPNFKQLQQEELIPFLTEYGKNNPETIVQISCKYGAIKIKLHKDTPLHRANFIRLAKLGYFNTTLFHRVSPNFVVQGGNSERTDTAKMRGKVGSYLIPSEFKAGHSHKRGAFGAAKYSEQNVSKASSPFEFYIVQKKDGAPHIDKDHTVFGYVLSGMDVIDAINKLPVDESEWPVKNIPITVTVIN